VVGECEMSRCVRFKGRGQWLNNCEKIVSFSKASSQYWGGGKLCGGDWQGLCDIFLIELNTGYVVGEYEHIGVLDETLAGVKC